MSKKVQFIYLLQEEYDSLPIKSDASLYFISDNRRIYRGQHLFGGMNLDSSTFKVDGKQVSTQGHTHSISELGIDEIECENLDANGIRVNGKDVSVEGHRHNVSDIDGLSISGGGGSSIDIPTRTSQLMNDSGYITSSDVGIGTLTIQRNGVAVQSFNANSSLNATANISVPTKVSDLTNDSGYQNASQVNDIVTQRVNDAIQVALDAYYGGN